MAPTPIRGLPEMAGSSDLASSIDDTFNAAMAVLDGAAIVVKDVFANRPDPATAKQNTVFLPTDLPGFLYLSDGASWIEVAPGMGSAPIGSSMEWWGASDPGDTRWVKMDGRALSTTTFAALYTLIGNTYDTFRGAVAPGAGLFRIPNMAGLVSVGSGAGSGLTNRVLGATGGEESHLLSTAELPAHSHPLGGDVPRAALGWGFENPVTGSGDASQKIPYIGTSTSTTSITATQNTGSGASHNNMPPFVVANRILRIA